MHSSPRETGKLLWSIEISEEGYGPYNDPSGQSVVGIDRSGIQTQVTTSTQLDPPTYEEVSAQVGKILRKEFPPPPKKKEEKPESDEKSKEKSD